VLAVSQVDSALKNLLDNAARYNTPPDPRVEVTLYHRRRSR
jgi:K+-sensing histidine kinase KdpD